MASFSSEQEEEEEEDGEAADAVWMNLSVCLCVFAVSDASQLQPSLPFLTLSLSVCLYVTHPPCLSALAPPLQ